MTVYLRQSTASQEVTLGYFVDSTDGNTEKTALTIANTDIKVWKNGATTLSSKNSGGATHISNGIYYAVLDATDTDTLGPLRLFVHVSGALPCILDCCVLSAANFDALIASSSNLTVTAGTVSDKTGYSISGTKTTLDALNDISTSDVSTIPVDDTVTLKQAIAVILAVSAGKSAGGGSATITFRDAANTKNRVTATVDAQGDRTAITIDGA